MSTFKERALPMIAKGLPVVRLHPRSKVPTNKSWQNLATTDVDTITTWDAEVPNANCGVVAKSDGYLFLEIDDLAAIEKFESETGEKFPATFTVHSSPGKKHFYFSQTDESRECGSITQNEITFGSLRQNNAFVVAPNSVHPTTGEPYVVVEDAPIVPIPSRLIAWLEDQVKTKRAAEIAERKSNPNSSSSGFGNYQFDPTGTFVAGSPIPLGQHDNTLFAIACSLREKGWEFEKILPVLEETCTKRCVGFGTDWQDMCRQKAKSACRYPAGSSEPTLLIGGKLPGQDAVQQPQPKAEQSVVTAVTPSSKKLVARQLSTGEGAEWVDIFGVVHQGVMPESALEDFIEGEDYEHESGVILYPVSFSPLINKKRLKKDLPSWLSQEARAPHSLKSCGVEWIADRFAMHHGLSEWVAERGSFKSILATMFAHALLQADKTETGEGTFLGRAIRSKFDPSDKRPLRVYYVDNEGPKELTQRNCLRVGLDDAFNKDGNFRLYGVWDEYPINRFDDPRLLEAAKRERVFFIFDSLSHMFEGLNENDTKDGNLIMTKAKKLAILAEGILILHHDNKNGGWRGGTPIVDVPDMCFSLKRDKPSDRVTFSEIRFKAVENYKITAELAFGRTSGTVIDDHITYKVQYDSLDPETKALEKVVSDLEAETIRVVSREEKAAQKAYKQKINQDLQWKHDREIILRANKIIEDRECQGLPPMNQSALAKAVGIASNRMKSRIFCTSTPDNPRPWRAELDANSKYLIFFSNDDQKILFTKYTGLTELSEEQLDPAAVL